MAPLQTRGASLPKDTRDRQDRAPASRRCLRTQNLPDPGEVPDGPHLATVKAKHKAVLDTNDADTPPALGGKVQREGRRGWPPPLHETHEGYDSRSRGVTSERVLCDKPEDVGSAADHDRRFEWQSASYLCPKIPAGDLVPSDQRTGRTHVDDIELLQGLCQHARTKGSVPADVDSLEKNHECHGSVIYPGAGRAARI